MEDRKEHALKKHREWQGKIEVITRAPLDNKEDLAVAYTPGVAEPCLEIAADESKAYEYTRKGNLVAVITDGTAVLGLGDIGASAGMPVMEGKCALFKRFADVDAFPLCIDSKDPKVIVETILNISKSFGGINLEDISAPRCFEIEQELIERCDIPVFHDDQHGTAIITCAALLNAVKVTGRQEKMGQLKIVINGAGAAGISIARLINQMGFGDIILCNSKGAVYRGAPTNNTEQEKMAQVTNRQNLQGSLADVIQGADVFVGVSKPGVLTKEMVRTMAPEPIVFAMANPVPEILPDEAKAGGAAVVGTGRSDFPNQVNNVLAFPGIFRGLLDVRASRVTDSMKEAAARGIASVIPEDELRADYVLPDPFDPAVPKAVAKAVAEEAIRLGVNRIGRKEYERKNVMIHFEKVTEENFEDVIHLQLKEEQKGFLENNLYSLAEAKVNPDLEPRAIYNDDQLIGFMLYYFHEGDPDYVYYKRLMIDRKWQGRGFGRAAMEAAIRMFKKEYPSIGCVELMHYLDNDAGEALYESLGFEATGEVRETIRPGTDYIDRERVRRFYY